MRAVNNVRETHISVFKKQLDKDPIACATISLIR